MLTCAVTAQSTLMGLAISVRLELVFLLAGQMTLLVHCFTVCAISLSSPIVFLNGQLFQAWTC